MSDDACSQNKYPMPFLIFSIFYRFQSSTYTLNDYWHQFLCIHFEFHIQLGKHEVYNFLSVYSFKIIFKKLEIFHVFL